MNEIESNIEFTTIEPQLKKEKYLLNVIEEILKNILF